VFPVPEVNPTLEDDPVPDEDIPDPDETIPDPDDIPDPDETIPDPDEDIPVPDEDNPAPDARPKRKSDEISKSHFHILTTLPVGALFLGYLKPSLQAVG
jgi:hypothetical protein